jgi:hypothetical protein
MSANRNKRQLMASPARRDPGGVSFAFRRAMDYRVCGSISHRRRRPAPHSLRRRFCRAAADPRRRPRLRFGLSTPGSNFGILHRKPQTAYRSNRSRLSTPPTVLGDRPKQSAAGGGFPWRSLRTARSLDEANRVLDGRDLLGRVIRDCVPKLFFEGEHQLGVKAVAAQIVDKAGILGHLCFIDAEMLDDDLLDPLGGSLIRSHSIGCFTAAASSPAPCCARPAASARHRASLAPSRPRAMPLRTYRALTSAIPKSVGFRNALKILVGPAGLEPATTPL